MSEEKIDQESLFLAQYEQLWEMKRHHALLCWQIPAVLGAGLGVAVQASSQETKTPFMFLLAVIYLCGMVVLFLRHNSFQEVFSRLISWMQEANQPLTHIPITGDALRKELKKPENGINLRNPAWLLRCWVSYAGWALIFVPFFSYVVVNLKATHVILEFLNGLARFCCIACR